jgi:hypothetical protein
MKAKNQIVIVGILSLLVTATIAAGNIVQTANAQTSPGNSGSPSTANAFGQGASQLAPLGPHAKAGGVAGSPPNFEDNQPGRFGIGNVGNALCGEKLTPGEVVSSGILTGASCP